MMEAPSLRCGDCGLHGEEHGGNVGSDHLLKGFERGGAKRRAARDAGIGENDVELAEFRNRLLNRSFRRRDVGGIGDDGERIRPKFLRSRFQRLLVAPCDSDPRPLGHEQFCGRKANAAVSTRYERRLVREPHGRLQWLHY